MRKEFRYGKKVREMRELRAWTQERLATVAGVEVRTIQRMERDLTKSPETLQDIAGAFDVDVDALRSTWLIPESRLLRVRSVSTHKDFIVAEEAHRSQAFVKTIMAPLKDEFETVVQELFERVFADRELIEPDERELWRSYTESIKEPLEALFDRGFSFFLLDEERDLLLRSDEIFKPLKDFIDDWKVRYFVLVPRHGCFRLGISDPLHRFNEQCPDAGDAMFRTLKEENAGVFVYANALFAATQDGGEDAARWCDNCFPMLPDGMRIGFEYIKQVTGLSRSQLSALSLEAAEQPLLKGLA